MGCIQSSFSQVVINEIMYHSQNSELEYIELLNSGAESVDISYWAIRDQQAFNTFHLPNGATIDPGQFVVIADDSIEFERVYGFSPDFGGIPFNFSNESDSVRLFDAQGTLIEEVHYSDRAPWDEAADGEGATLERINPRLPSELHQSWAASTRGGTPGRENSAYSDVLHPIFLNVDHTPKVPEPFAPVTVTADILNLDGEITSVILRYGHNQGDTYQSVIMHDDGQHEDGAAGDGTFGAMLDGSSNGTILRFYIEARSSTGITALMPEEGGDRPYLTVFEPRLFNENAPVLRVVMRPEVRQRFLDRYQTDEYFPGSMYEGDHAYYEIDIRHRGRSRSQNGRFKIRFPYDNLYQGKIRRLNFNGTDTATILREYLSFQLYHDSGIPNLETQLVRLHINGEPTRGTPYRVMIENPDSQFLRRKVFFNDDNGNLYKTTLDGSPRNKATWRYVGDDPDLYRTCYIKQTNETADDFSDIIQFCKTLDEIDPEDPDFAERVESVLDVDEFLRWMAVSALVAHWDSPYTDHGHNYVLYNDLETGQFNVIAWDLNGTFNYSSNQNDLNYRKHYTHIRSTKFAAINKILNHPRFGAQYYLEIDRLLKSLFTIDNMNRRIDEARDRIQASNSSVSFLRNYVTHRREDLADWINQVDGLAFISEPVYQASVNQPYRYNAVAVEYRYDLPMSYRLTQAPDWIDIDPERGVISGRPPETGRFTIAIEAGVGTGVDITQTFELLVVDPYPRLIVNFNEESGAVVDLSPFDHSGELNVNAARGPGLMGNGISLRRNNAYVSFPHHDSLNLQGSITVEAWIRPDNVSNGNPIILTKGGADQFNYTLMLGYGPWSWDAMEPCFMPHRFDIENRVYYGRKEIEARLQNREWAHIAGTYDSAKERVRVYANDYPIVESSSRARMLANLQPLLIGFDSSQNFNGVIDSVRILPFAKEAFASGLCLSRVDVSGISPAQDRMGLSLSQDRNGSINTGDYCVYLVNSNRWLMLPDHVLNPGESFIWWMDELGLETKLPEREILALYPAKRFGIAGREVVLDQVAWGGSGPGAIDPGVQAALWLPDTSVNLPEDQATSLSLIDFANNDDMHNDWTTSPQLLSGPSITSLQINEGAASTDSNTVRLAIESEPSATPLQLRLSNTPGFGSDWQAYQDSVSWNLSPGDGRKTVFAQLRDSNGMRSRVITASIAVDASTGVSEWKILDR